MDDKLAVRLLEDNIITRVKKLQSDVALLQKLSAGTGAGTVNNLSLSILTEELSPTSGDLFVMERAGVLYKVDFDNMPGGGGPSDEYIQDLVGAMVSGNTETGIAVTYDDTNAKLDFVAEVTQSELDAVSASIPTTEQIQDIVGGMVSGNTETRIAVTYDDTNGKIDFVVDAHAAALKQYWDVDAPPASPSAYDFEFNAGSGGVPSGLTEFDQNSKLTVVENSAEKCLILTHSGAGGALDLAGVYQAVPAGDFTIMTRCAMLSNPNNTQDAGICLFQDATTSTGDIKTFGIRAPSAIRILAWPQYNQTPSDNYNQAPWVIDVYLRIRRTSTTYNFEWSARGRSWTLALGTSALGFTPSHMGLFLQNSTSTTNYAIFNFFRYVGSDIGLSGALAGQLAGIYA